MCDTNSVTFPAHYQFSDDIYDVRDVIRERTVVYLDNGLPAEGIYDYDNAIKYILRGPAKNGIEDLKKAQYCLDSLIGILEADAEPAANQPAKYGYGVFAVDMEVTDGYPTEPGRAKEEDALEAAVDQDVLDDAITRIREAMKNKQEEMAYHIMTMQIRPPSPCDRLTGMRPPTFNE